MALSKWGDWYKVLSKWDKRFMDLATLVAGWSKDDGAKVGCVIVDRKQRVVSLGYNGFARGVDDTIKNRDQKLMRTLHAEDNALSFASRSVEGCTAYITHAPCAPCTARLIQHGIDRIVFNRPDEGFLNRWGQSYMESLQMMYEAGVDLEVVQ